MLQSEVNKLHITNSTITSLADIKNLGIKVGTQDGTTEQSELQAAGVSDAIMGQLCGLLLRTWRVQIQVCRQFMLKLQ